MAAAEAIGNESLRDVALSGLAGHLSGEQLGDALAAAKAIGDGRYRAEALSGLAGHLSGETRGEALVKWLEIGDRLARPNLLSAIAAFTLIIADLGGTEALVEVHEATRDTADWYP